MARPKDIGTSRETWFVKKAEQAGMQARRSTANAASEDVIIEFPDWHDVGVGTHRIVHEVKDRAALSLHPVLAKAVKLHGPEAAVIWHRKKKLESGARVPAGPTLAAITVERYLELLRREQEWLSST